MFVKPLKSMINKGIWNVFMCLQSDVTNQIQKQNLVYKTSFVTTCLYKKSVKNRDSLQIYGSVYFVTEFCYIYKVTELQ